MSFNNCHAISMIGPFYQPGGFALLGPVNINAAIDIAIG
jgi:hypothetical protein